MHNLELKSSPYNILTLYSTDLITRMIREYNESPDSIYFGLNWELLGQLGQGEKMSLFSKQMYVTLRPGVSRRSLWRVRSSEMCTVRSSRDIPLYPEDWRSIFLTSIGKLSVKLEIVTSQKRFFFLPSLISICQRQQGHFHFLFSFPSFCGIFLSVSVVRQKRVSQHCLPLTWFTILK
jgi:hypothetical protein